MELMVWDNDGEDYVQIILKLLNTDFFHTDYDESKQNLIYCLKSWFDSKEITIIDDKPNMRITIHIPSRIFSDGFEDLDIEFLKYMTEIEYGRYRYNGEKDIITN